MNCTKGNLIQDVDEKNGADDEKARVRDMFAHYLILKNPGVNIELGNQIL